MTELSAGKSEGRAETPAPRYYDVLAELGGGQGERHAARRCAMARLQSVAAKLESAAEESARQFGIHVSALYVLTLIYRAEPRRVPASRLQRALGFTAGGVTRRLDSMIAKDLVRRVADPADGRSWLVALTGPGERLAEKIFASSRHNTSSMADRIATREWTELERILAVIDDAMD